MFDEVVDRGEDLWATLDSDADHDNCRQHHPGDKTNDGSIASQPMRIRGCEFYKSSDANFHAGSIFTAEQKCGNCRGHDLALSMWNHSRDSNQRRGEVQSDDRTLLCSVFVGG